MLIRIGRIVMKLAIAVPLRSGTATAGEAATSVILAEHVVHVQEYILDNLPFVDISARKILGALHL